MTLGDPSTNAVRCSSFITAAPHRSPFRYHPNVGHTACLSIQARAPSGDAMVGSDDSRIGIKEVVVVDRATGVGPPH